MKLAASNIAWEPAEDDAAAAVLRRHGFTGVEIAPSKRWESPLDATKKDIAAYRGQWESRGLRMVAMQSLLFGRSDLQLFGSAITRRALSEYLTALIEMAQGLGVSSLVFGSPKNRRRGPMPLDEATGIAIEFFRELGAIAIARECTICIEPNPVAYECDFLTTTPETAEFVNAVGSRGIGVNGDAGTIALSSEDAATSMRAAAGQLRHFHASEANLVEISQSPLHEAASKALRATGYAGWVSIEMRAPSSGSALDALDRAAAAVRSLYGDGG